MSIKPTPERVHELADRLLLEGIPPTIETLCQGLGISEPGEQLEEALQSWWGGLQGRVYLTPPTLDQAPDALARALKIIWQDAVREAVSQLSAHSETVLMGLQREPAGGSVMAHGEYENLEGQLQGQLTINADSRNQVKMLETEVSALRSSLAGEVALRKQLEERLRDAYHDLKRELQALEDAKRAFDQRLREEQTHSQELVAKAKADTRRCRASLEQLRDDAGKKESAITKNLHNLRGEQVKKEAKIETLKGQVKGLEGELKAMRADTGDQGRQLSKANARLLTATNQVKRLEGQVKEQEKELLRERQRLAQQTAEGLEKEAELRVALKKKEAEVTRIKTSLNGLQQKISGQEEQIRRLNIQLGK